MCGKANEIQNIKPSVWDVESHNFWHPNSIPKIWLPRQDQLQEMVDANHLDNHRYSNRMVIQFFPIVMPTCDIEECAKVKINSMEQLWLAFVMKEKFNKTWDGKNWSVK